MGLHEAQYLDLLRHVLNFGEDRADRTGVGTRGVFAPLPLRFRMEYGGYPRVDDSVPIALNFPLLTTKKVYWKGVVEELLWFLRGETNVRSLQEKGVHIWDAWTDKDGELGPVYGSAWRRFGAQPTAIPQPKPRLLNGVEATYLGVANGAGKEGHSLAKTWEGMIARCYGPNSPSYSTYGARGVHVCNRWLEFRAFAEDAVTLPGWLLREKNEARYVLDKDGLGDGFRYGPDTCQWVTDKMNARLRFDDRVFTVQRVADGAIFSFTSITDFAEEMGFDSSNFSDLWTGNKRAKVRNGFALVSVEDRHKGVDQIRDVTESLKRDPTGRRHIVSAWDVGNLRYMKLPPCHMMFQFYVSNTEELHCQMYQRSADLFLGVPFNIASYALLTCMMAKVVGLKPGELTMVFGDAHVYNNHADQVREQLSREPRDLPMLTFRAGKTYDSLDDFTAEDIILTGYDPYPAIKAEVAV